MYLQIQAAQRRVPVLRNGGWGGRNKTPEKVSWDRKIQHLTFVESPARLAVMRIKS